MNKFTREHYPASKLPVELRGEIDPARHVTVTVEEEELPPKQAMTLEQILESTKEFRTRPAGEIDADIRAQRDAWSD